MTDTPDWADEEVERIEMPHWRGGAAALLRKAKAAGMREAEKIAEHKIHPDSRTEYTDMGEDGRGDWLIKGKTTSLADIIRAAADKLEEKS